MVIVNVNCRLFGLYNVRTLRRQWPNSSLLLYYLLLLHLSQICDSHSIFLYFLVLHDVVCISGETSVFWSPSYTLRLRLFTVVLMVFWRVRPGVWCLLGSLTILYLWVFIRSKFIT